MLVVREVLEVELEQVAARADEPAQLVREARCPVRREAHHLPLVAVAWEAEPLRDGGVEHAERVRERDALEHLQRRALPARRASCSPRRRRRRPRAPPRPRTPDGKNALARWATWCSTKCHSQSNPSSARGSTGTDSLEAADRDRIGRREARLRQAPGRRQRREAGDVLHPREALLLCRGDEPAVDDERSGGIAVVRVQAEDRRQAVILDRLSSLSGSVQGPFRDG